MAAYCTSADLSTYGIRAEALRGIATDDLPKAIGAASDTIDSYLRGRFTLPLVAWGQDIRKCCAIIAAYELVATRGLNPSVGGGEVLQARYDTQIAWLRDVAANKVTPEVTDSGVGGGGSSDVSAPVARAQVVSNSQRGWYDDDGCPGPFVGGR